MNNKELAIKERIKRKKEYLKLEYNSIKHQANRNSPGKNLLDVSYNIVILETELQTLQNVLRILEQKESE